MSYKMLAACLATALMLTGCSDRGGAAATSAATAVMETQDISLLEGRLTIKLPTSLEEQIAQGGMWVFSDDTGGVTLVGAAATDDASTLLKQTENNLAAADASMKVVDRQDIKLGDFDAKRIDVDTRSDGRDVRMIMALAVIAGQMVVIQVVGARNNADAVSQRATSIFQSSTYSAD